MKTLYRASRVRTLSIHGEGQWVLVDERHVERVGAGEPPAADRVVDLPGTTILPGFVDAHVHLSGTGMALDGLDLSEARSPQELVALARDHAAGRSGPVLGQGFDETAWVQGALPALEDLDEISGEPVILVRTDGYLSLANSAALSAAVVHDLAGVERDAQGRPTGTLRHEANAHAQRWYFDSLPDAAIEEAQLRAAGLAASRGVTCLHEMAIPDKRGRRDVDVLLRHLDDLPADVITYIADRDLPYVIDHGQPRIGGDLFLDGSIGARTAALVEPYVDADDRGSLSYEDDDLAEFLHNAHLAGLQTGLHVIGDAAIEQALRAWERVYGALDSRRRRHFRARRHRLEHFEMASAGQVERAAALGLAISVQPGFDAAWGHQGGMYEQRLGRDRAWRMNPFATLVARGLEVGGGSDTPVTPLDPMLGIWALENHHDPEQRMSRDAAVRMYTIGGARLGHLEKKGRLEPGAAADLAAYDTDPMDVLDVRGLRPVLTVSRGRDVYAR
ncbi:MAG TPA: amidohydrolase family protein [Actinomycetota bacterium]|nr:amidohydrolase family protein [Actinomycetota bacterium]